MGTWYGWKCNKCNYFVVVSGGKDSGVFTFTQTFHCRTCKEIMDVTISESEWGTNCYETHYCEKCNNPLEVWDTKKKPCPNCNGKMKIDKNHPIADWD